MKKIVLIFGLLLLLISAVYSMDIEIGSGTTTTNYMPTNGWYNYSWSNFVIDADLIGMAVDINQIQFNVSDQPASYESLNQKVYFKHTTNSTVPVAYPNPIAADFTLVYDGTVTWNGSGWQGVMLDTPFAYNGTDNLQIVWENRDGSYAVGYPNFFTTNVGTNVGAYKYADVSFPVVGGTNVAYFPNLILSGELPAGSVTGIISDGTNGLGSVAISINETDYQTVSLADGSFEFPEIPAGDYTLTATATGYYDETVEFNVIKDQETQVYLVLTPLPTISISGQITSSITDTGIPATVSLSGYDDFSTIADSFGNYTINNVWVNHDYTLEVAYSWYDNYISEVAIAESDVELNIVLDLIIPTNLSGVASNGIVSLAWDAFNTQDRAWLGYNLYRNGVILNTEPISEPFYLDADITYGQTYNYFVKNVLDEGESDPSNTVAVYAVNYAGSGTEAEPYLINNLADLRYLSETSPLWKSNYHYQQTADIDAFETREWNAGSGFSPIGNITLQFKGSYNGNGYLISNLYINRPTTYMIGLFGYTNAANISNIALVENEISGQHYAGSLVGYASGSSLISNCCATGSVSGTGNYIGGLVGYALSSTINNSFASGNVSGTSNVGGLVGYANNTSTFNDCYALGDVLGRSDLVGGLIGFSNAPTLNCFAAGSVSGAVRMGGLVGASSAQAVSNSFWDINTSNKTTSAGGIGKTTAEMKTLSTYLNAGWDFVEETANGTNDLWVYYANNYPHLSWERFLIPDFTVSQDTILYGITIEFTHTSVGQIDEYLWEFGDGNSSSEANPSHTYGQTGVFSVTLTISNTHSTEAITKTDYITVNPAPDISVSPLEINVSVIAGESNTQFITIENNGEEWLDASLSIGSNRMRSGTPEIIYGQAQSSDSVESGLRSSKNLIPSTKSITYDRSDSCSILYVTAVGGDDTTFKTAISNLSNVSAFTEFNASSGTPNVDYMLQYDLVIVASNIEFNNPTLLGNNIASYCDAGGKLIVLQFSLCISGVGHTNLALSGAIIGTEYMPLAVTSYTWNTATGYDFISHPITAAVSVISTAISARTHTQGIGISLGSYTNGYPIAAYNPNKPIVAINVYPQDGNWGGDFIQMVSNSIDWLCDIRWMALSENELSIAPGSSETIEVTLNSEELEFGVYTQTISISSNDPDEPLINIPITMNVVQVFEAEFTASTTEVLAGETIQFTDLTIGNANHWKWYFDNDDSVDSNLQHPTYSYNTNGIYSVSLVVSHLDANNIVVASDSVCYNDYINVVGSSIAGGSYSGTWGLASSPYNVYGSILIESGTSLIIEEGVLINFVEDAEFAVAGQLLANNITFTSPGIADREIGVWQGLNFTASSNNSTLTNSLIENATQAIQITNASPTLRGLELRGLNRELPAIKISGSSSAILEDLDIDNFDNGLEIYGEDSTCIPTLTNIRVRHTTNTSRIDGVGINLIGSANVQLKNSLIAGFGIGLKINGANSSIITKNTLLNNTTAIELSGAQCNPQIHHNHLANQLGVTATGFAINNIANIQILNNNIIGFSRVVTGTNSAPYFSQNIIWGAPIQANQLSTGSAVNSLFEYNDISMASGLAPGTGNLNVNPLFVSEEGYNLVLGIYSDCIDAGNPGLARDPDGSIADLGMNYVHHLVDFASSNRFANAGTLVEFENRSQGHNDASTSVLWDFGDGESSIEHDPIHIYIFPGTYDVTLTMTTGSIVDTMLRASYVIIQGQALSAPQNPAITTSASNINLTWDAVTEPGSDIPIANVSYLIYSCNTPLGTYEWKATVNSLNWTHENIAQTADRQFYFVIANLSSARLTVEDFVNTHRYLTRDGEVVKQPNLKEISKKK